MRNLLEEFRGNHGLRPPTILGVREHVFTGRLDVFSIYLSVSLFVCVFVCLSLSHTHTYRQTHLLLFLILLILCLNMQCFLLGLVHVQPRD